MAAIGTTTTTTHLNFKSKRFDPQMNTGVGVFASKGTFDGNLLDLGWKQIPLEHIAKTSGHFQRMIIETTNGEDATYAEIRDDKVMDNLIRSVNKAASKLQADQKKIEMEQQFRSMTCPYCSSTINLSAFEETPQVYCPYCDTIFHTSGRIEGEEDMHACSRCGLYSKPEDFKYTYIECLLYVVSIQERKRVLCKACQKEKARKTCLLNSLFLVGIPCAIAALVTAKKKQDLPPLYEELDTANTLVYQGKNHEQIEEGTRIYQHILRGSKADAGVQTNLGVAKILTDDWLSAVAALEHAIRDCGNYELAALTLSQCYSHLGGNTEKVAHLEEQFGWDKT